MNKIMKQCLFWSPRVLSILFAVFVSLFALDVFSEGFGPVKTILDLLVHLLPTGIIAAVIVISWRREWIGAMLFTAGGLYYLFTALKHLDWVPTISGPAFAIGILFLFNWLYRRELRAGS
jgi:hypothetical protein